ncbi:MAG TPA: hypothetical protein DCR55_02865 [Lentisphaeria bacterium]|nr:hypothetical protein [Lentisphaeria bacterium]
MFNLLISVESILGGDLLLRGCGGCIRDLASVDSSYRTVAEIAAALGLIKEVLNAFGASSVHWLLDRPASGADSCARYAVDG